MTLINLVFPKKTKRSHDQHILLAKMQFSDGEIPIKSVIISAICMWKSSNVVRITLLPHIFLQYQFGHTFPYFFKTLKNLIVSLTTIVFRCQNLWIVSHFPESIDVSAGCKKSLTCTGCSEVSLLARVNSPRSLPQTSQYPGNILSQHQNTQLVQLFPSWYRQRRWVAKSDGE